MSQFILHLREKVDYEVDPYVVDLPGIEEVKKRALKEAREILSHDARDGILDLRFRIDIEDGCGSVIYSLPFKDAVKIIKC